MKKLIEQILKFGVVGFLCFFLDFGIMVALTELGGIPSLTSAGISFTISVIVNYVLSIMFVFETNKNANKMKEFLVFVILSVIGLGINELIMWGADQIHIYYMISKVIATGVVMVYNFITRKMFIEKK